MGRHTGKNRQPMIRLHGSKLTGFVEVSRFDDRTSERENPIGLEPTAVLRVGGSSRRAARRRETKNRRQARTTGLAALGLGPRRGREPIELSKKGAKPDRVLRKSKRPQDQCKPVHNTDPRPDEAAK